MSSSNSVSQVVRAVLRTYSPEGGMEALSRPDFGADHEVLLQILTLQRIEEEKRAARASASEQAPPLAEAQEATG